jgi:hypothetical protein
MRAASDCVVPVSLELGGKSRSIVFPDANEDWVVDGITPRCASRGRQSCTAGSRLFLHRGIFNTFSVASFCGWSLPPVAWLYQEKSLNHEQRDLFRCWVNAIGAVSRALPVYARWPRSHGQKII